MGKMSREDLFREIGEIDEAYVEEAEKAGRKRRPALRVVRMLAAAASLVLCVGVGYVALLVIQPKGNTGGAMDSASGANGNAPEAAREQYSMAEDTAQEMAGQAAEEAGMQAASGGTSEKEPEQAGQGNPEAAPKETPAGQDVDEMGFPYTESDRGQQDELSQTREEEKETSVTTDNDSVIVETSQNVGTAMNLTWEAARADTAFGRYADVQVPEGYSFTSGSRSASALHLVWNNGMEEISISCRQADEDVSDWLADVEKPEEYDLGLYTIPWSDSVPQELIQRVSNAAFRPEQVTLEIVTARTYQVQEAGDVSGNRTRIGILYNDNVLVEISSKGPSAEEIYAMINLEN